MVANDTMAGAVITELKNSHLAGQVAVSGQDASAAGLQRIMDGTQCFTIYKPTTAEAGPAIDAIAQLLTGSTPKTNGHHDRPVDPQGRSIHPGHADRHHQGKCRAAVEPEVRTEEHGLHRRLRRQVRG